MRVAASTVFGVGRADVFIVLHSDESPLKDRTRRRPLRGSCTSYLPCSTVLEGEVEQASNDYSRQ